MISTHPIHDRFLELGAMKNIREAVVDKYEWFLHQSEMKNFESVKDGGLQRRDPGAVHYRPSAKHQSIFGSASSMVLFLTPLPTKNEMPFGNPRFCVAVHKEYLPIRVGIDWSFDGPWNDAARLADASQPESDVDIFLEVLETYGSLACYDPIPRNYLRLWDGIARRECPGQWPRFDDVSVPVRWNAGAI